MRYLILGTLAIGTLPLTDWLVDRQFQKPQTIGYTAEQVHAVDEMVAASMCVDFLCQLDEKRRAK